MKKKPYKYLKFYHECMRTGELPKIGLCYSLGEHDPLLRLFTPTRFGLIAGAALSEYCWAAADSYDAYIKLSFEQKAHLFSELRQNIVLFMAAMNGEL